MSKLTVFFKIYKIPIQEPTNTQFERFKRFWYIRTFLYYEYPLSSVTKSFSSENTLFEETFFQCFLT